ncbi:hypothetical protein M2323_004300 [Rhodoblastus acidophilus]|uniref:hypothetical protein n=1 Tax=Rhodoblastus acidophilus TaxID=1074 RepID=UPI002224473C|nr:hypothetical protein [Rhodoblastus acidophilus]MCW2286503.1 hypothetical protein [Rhodoblastus acidophilus]MCW2335352.1 hypothetical protein [Rhodoblastus acidophilus]
MTLAANAASPGFKSLSSLGASMSDVSPRGAMSMRGGKVGGFETSLDKATQDLAEGYGGKLYLTTAWPQTGSVMMVGYNRPARVCISLTVGPPLSPVPN